MWKVEIIQRAGNKILVFYYMADEQDESFIAMNEARGSIEIRGKEEEEKWQKLIKHLND